MPSILAGILLRLRGVRVVAILHEIALNWEVSHRRKLHSLSQRLALPFVLAGANEIVVTTERRQAWLRSRFRVQPRRLHVLPVFSNFPVAPQAADHESSEDHPTEGAGIVVPGWATTPGLESIFLRALSAPQLASRGIRVALLGAPGADSEAAGRWVSAAKKEGQLHRLRFTGITSPAEYSRDLQKAVVSVLLFGDGPSTRHTLLAAALAHGCAILAIDGADTWEVLRAEQAVELVPAHSESIASALASLLDDPPRRERLSIRSRTVYANSMALSIATETICELLWHDSHLSRRRTR
jgi:hypothetical protein